MSNRAANILFAVLWVAIAVAVMTVPAIDLFESDVPVQVARVHDVGATTDGPVTVVDIAATSGNATREGVQLSGVLSQGDHVVVDGDMLHLAYSPLVRALLATAAFLVGAMAGLAIAAAVTTELDKRLPSAAPQPA